MDAVASEGVHPMLRKIMVFWLRLRLSPGD
jgi:hypothetical protein